MALQPAAVYHKMQDVLRRYELGKLKGQKERLMIGGNPSKSSPRKVFCQAVSLQVFPGLISSKQKQEIFWQNKCRKISCKKIMWEIFWQNECRKISCKK